MNGAPMFVAIDEPQADLTTAFQALLDMLTPDQQIATLLTYQSEIRACYCDDEREAVLRDYVEIIATEVCGLEVRITS